MHNCLKQTSTRVNQSDTGEMIDEYASDVARERPVCGNLGDTVLRPVLAGLPDADAMATHRPVSTPTCCRDRPLSSKEFANLPINEHWHRCAIEESIPCETMMRVP